MELEELDRVLDHYGTISTTFESGGLEDAYLTKNRDGSYGVFSYNVDNQYTSLEEAAVCFIRVVTNLLNYSEKVGLK